MTCTCDCHNENEEAEKIYEEISNAELVYHVMGLANTYALSHEDKLKFNIAYQKALDRLSDAYKAKAKLIRE